jgi:L-fuconolactonase
MRIDAHHHLWRFSPEEYGWIGPGDLSIRRDFLLPELHAELAAAGIEGSVVVQARQSLTETRWLLELASASPRLRGVVGWAPLADPGLPGILDTLEGLPGAGRLVGFRHVVQEETDPGFLLRPAFSRGLAELAARGLAYDLLVKPHQLGQALACVDAHPGLGFIVDHAAKPRFARPAGRPAEAPLLDPGTWAEGMRVLAERPNVACKFSGLALEAGHGWTVDSLRPCLDTLLDCFGPSRLMFGSDWPVCLLATGYRPWLAAVETLIAGLSDSERAAILGGTAERAYRLKEPA